jgi:hypothetical protein
MPDGNPPQAACRVTGPGWALVVEGDEGWHGGRVLAGAEAVLTVCFGKASSSMGMSDLM